MFEVVLSEHLLLIIQNVIFSESFIAHSLMWVINKCIAPIPEIQNYR